MKRWMVVCLLLGLVVLPVGVALSIDGAPTSQNGSLTVAGTAVSFPTGTCRTGGVSAGGENAALIQIQTAGIYFLLNSTTATPTATSFNGSAGDWYEIAHPYQFRAIEATGTTAYVAYQCFER